MPARARIFTVLVVTLVVSLGAALIYSLDPATTRFYPRCALRALTGLSCAGCGTLRAVHQLVHGNLAAAFRLNPLAVLALPAIGGVLALRAAGIVRRPVTGALFERPGRLLWLAGLLLAFGVLRNLFGF